MDGGQEEVGEVLIDVRGFALRYHELEVELLQLTQTGECRGSAEGDPLAGGGVDGNGEQVGFGRDRGTERGTGVLEAFPGGPNIRCLQVRAQRREPFDMISP
ncbi:MAG: hypothetical protein M3228_14125 [Actinomycetota bacterium]|nr:hypothetical protein [Actinomycetota bacterium]